MSIELTVHGLTLCYESHPILQGLEFRIEPGERVALLGANGAGKSTLLRCISKVMKPTGGTVLMDGKEIKGLSSRELARTLAVVPQETRADFDFTVREVVMMGRLPFLSRFQQEGAHEERIVQQSMVMTGVDHLADRPITTLSGGENQRVIISRALCQEPRLLLLDEPTANLDLGYQHSLLELIARLNSSRGITVVAAIHDLNLAARFFESMILLEGGKVLAAGRAETVLTSDLIRQAYGVDTFVYRHPLTGSLQVCVRDGDTVQQGAKPRVHVIGGGEEALPALEYLRRQGAHLSVGPVTAEDSSYRFASFYGIDVIESPPFSPVSNAAHRAHLDMVCQADLIVVPPIPFGWGNLRNLKAVESGFRRGKKVVIIQSESLRDFTGGRAERIIYRLKAGGAPVLKHENELAKYLKEYGLVRHLADGKPP